MHSSPMSPARLCRSITALLLVPLCHASPGSAFAAEPEAWPVIGRQGLVQLVLVPSGQAADETAYTGQISRLCAPERTCFLNFYTNSTGVAPTTPLPDAISNEATATYRRSMKNGVELLKWSCRLKVPGKECF